MGRRKVSRLYPLLFAVVPFMHVVATNPGQSRITTLGLIVVALAGGFGLLYLLVHWALKGSNTASLTPLIILSVVAWFYLGPLAQKLIENATGTSLSSLVPAFFGLLLSAGFLFWLRRRPRIQDFAHRVLPLIALLLVGWSALGIALNEIRAHRAITHSALVTDLAAPITVAGSKSLEKPDIYLIVLDEYANASVLQEVFGDTNREFEDSLRALGFTIPKLVRSNYTVTTLSIPSLLNFAYLSRLMIEVGRGSNDGSLANYLVENNRVVRILKAQGYRFVFFPSQWWHATDHNRHADHEYRIGRWFSVRRALAASQLATLLWRFTLLGSVGSLHPIYAEYIRQTFDGIRRLDTTGNPTFVFAHLIFPHLPYVLNARCEPEVALHGGHPDRRYLDQVHCANALILGLVGSLLRRRGKPPVILLQGDHGTAMRGFDTTRTARDVSPEQARERFGAFGAYYLPAGGGRLFTDTVTVVNVFRKVLSHYFAAALPLERNRLFLSVEDRPFDFVEVDPASLR